MDLVASAENIIVAMMHINKKGDSKLLSKCSLPLASLGCVKRMVTELAVLDVTHQLFLLVEHAPEVSIQEIKDTTAGKLIIPDLVKEMHF
jgi:3-oxoacid CoA-transferase B subunit